jgi:hypothetical protein
MIYADFDYYVDDYLQGRDPVIPDEEYLFWEKAARHEVDALTYNKIQRLTEIPEAVKECICAVAELLYRSEKLTASNLDQGFAGAMVSYSNDGQSGSFDVSGSAYTEEGRKAEVKRLCRQYLIGTGLLYAGVTVYES